MVRQSRSWVRLYAGRVTMPCMQKVRYGAYRAQSQSLDRHYAKWSRLHLGKNIVNIHRNSCSNHVLLMLPNAAFLRCHYQTPWSSIIATKRCVLLPPLPDAAFLHNQRLLTDQQTPMTFFDTSLLARVSATVKLHLLPVLHILLRCERTWSKNHQALQGLHGVLTRASSG